MKVTFNGGYYIVRTGTRRAQYLEGELAMLPSYYKARIKRLQRGLKDLEAIEQYRKEQS